jgi:phosphoglycerol transferase MdoB-like AlkP superfamily enzyme
MFTVVKAALAYTLPVFAVAFVLGALRVTLVAPQIGPLLAVALEVPIVLALSWTVAGRVLARWPLSQAQRSGMALLAFVVLMLLELLTAFAFGQTPSQFLSAMSTPAGALGLAGQIGFALIPLVRQARG